MPVSASPRPPGCFRCCWWPPTAWAASRPGWLAARRSLAAATSGSAGQRRDRRHHVGRVLGTQAASSSFSSSMPARGRSPWRGKCERRPGPGNPLGRAGAAGGHRRPYLAGLAGFPRRPRGWSPFGRTLAAFSGPLTLLAVALLGLAIGLLGREPILLAGAVCLHHQHDSDGMAPPLHFPRANFLFICGSPCSACTSQLFHQIFYSPDSFFLKPPPCHGARATVFKIATTADEFEQIHRLNYQTFVGEIPQHAPNPEGWLVDKFHAENVYLIGVRDGKVIAMMAVRRRRPFSLDAKIPDLDRWLPAGPPPGRNPAFRRPPRLQERPRTRPIAAFHRPVLPRPGRRPRHHLRRGEPA